VSIDRSGVAALLLLLFQVPASAGAGEWQGQQIERDGIPVVQNPETPADGVVAVELEELWRVGGHDEDVLIGVIANLVVDRNRDVYLLDSQLSEVQVFSEDGEWLRSIGREGEGPGEFRNGSDLYLGPEGNLGVVQIFPGRIVQLTPQGDPAGTFPLPAVDGGGFQLVHRVRGTRDHIVMAYAQTTVEDGQQKQVSMLRAFDATGHELARYHQESHPTQYGGMQFDEKTFSNYERRWAVAPDGRVAAALDFDAYRIHIWSADGTVQHIIERPDWQLLSRSDEERQRFQRFFDGITRWNPGSTFEVSRTHTSIGQLHFRDDGSLWVLSSRGRVEVPDDVAARFDVYDAQGRFVQQVDLKADFDPVEDGLFFAADRVYVVTDLFNAVMANLGGEEDADIEAEPVSVLCLQLDETALVRQ
jgi:hypothetical protein